MVFKEYNKHTTKKNNKKDEKMVFLKNIKKNTTPNYVIIRSILIVPSVGVVKT